MTQPWSDCPPPFPHCAPNSPALQAAYRPSWFSFPIRRAGLSSAGMQPEGLNGARRERGRAPERTRLLATLPCLGQGALRRTAATLLACGKDASKGARPGSCTERFDPGASFCMQVTVARTRGTARFGRAPSPPGFSPRRRGYGGRRPHPLKGHRPLRIPSAAALGTKRSTHAPLRASPPVGGARRALPAPAQGPSALKHPLRCRVWHETFHPRPPPGFSPRRRGYGGPCPHPLKGHRPLRIPSAAALGTKRSTHAPSGPLPPVGGARRALPAPAQGPSALENPLCCRAYLATPHPRPLRASPPVGGARRALPAPAQGPSALENPLCCRAWPELSRASPTHKDGRLLSLSLPSSLDPSTPSQIAT